MLHVTMTLGVRYIKWCGPHGLCGMFAVELTWVYPWFK